MTVDDVVAAKQATRRRVLALRDSLSADARERKAVHMTKKLTALPAFAAARTIAAYASFGTEFDTGPLLTEVLASGKRLLLPRVDRESHRIQFHVVTDLSGALIPGPWGIREPDPAQCAAADAIEIEFMLVPGVGFTRHCERLGYGGGFYDAVMGEVPLDTAKVAAAFDVQIVDELPLEPHDQRVDLVVTESATYVAPSAR